MSNLRLVAGSLAALLAAPLTAQAPPTMSARGNGFSLAVLRRDGIIIPVATLEGARWTNRWPAPHLRRDVPITMSDVPETWWPFRRPITAWTAHTIRGARRPIRVTQPVKITAQCQMQVGLRTDYLSVEPPVPDGVQPHPKDGLATTDDAPMEPVVIMNPISPDASTIAGLIAQTAERLESDVVRGVVAGAIGISGQPLPKPPDAATRGRTPITPEVIVATAGTAPGSRQYYFEGTKRYDPPAAASETEAGAEPCGYVAFVRSWLAETPAGPSPALVQVFFTDCRRIGIQYVFPLGAVRHDGKTQWVVQRTGWELERIEIVEVASGRVSTVFKTEAGACPVKR